MHLDEIDRQKLKKRNQNTYAAYVALLVQFLRIVG